MSTDPMRQTAVLLKRLLAADYSLDISADFDLPDDAAVDLDSRVPIPGNEATGIVPDGTGWDGFIEVEVRLADLGLKYEQVHGVALLEEISSANQALLVESLLLHLEPFRRWVTMLSPTLWSEAVAHGDERIDIRFDDEAIRFRVHACRVARAFNDDLAQAASEGEVS
jgi:hypothetical protein